MNFLDQDRKLGKSVQNDLTTSAEAGQIYLDVWKFGVNTALRISDIISIPMATIAELDEQATSFVIREQKTDKTRAVDMNVKAIEVARRRYAENPDDLWLFQSHRPRRGKRDPDPITRRSVGRVFASVGEQITPKVHLSTHSMRKTRGYAMHKSGAPIEYICKVLNHSHPAVTMSYIGLDAEMLKKSFMDMVL